jgi:hypothetical protein
LVELIRVNAQKQIQAFRKWLGRRIFSRKFFVAGR